MKFIVLTATALTLLTTVGCATVADTASSATSMMKKTVMGGGAIAEAKAHHEAAAKAGCAWKDTEKMIKKAEKLAAEGKTEEADALAGRAKRQSENGMKQCESEVKRRAAG